MSWTSQVLLGPRNELHAYFPLVWERRHIHRDLHLVNSVGKAKFPIHSAQKVTLFLSPWSMSSCASSSLMGRFSRVTGSKKVRNIECSLCCNSHSASGIFMASTPWILYAYILSVLISPGTGERLLAGVCHLVVLTFHLQFIWSYPSRFAHGKHETVEDTYKLGNENNSTATNSLQCKMNYS